MKILICACDSKIDYLLLNEAITILKHFNQNVTIDILIPRNQHLVFFGNPALPNIDNHIYIEDLGITSITEIKNTPEFANIENLGSYEKILDCFDLFADTSMPPTLDTFISFWKSNNFVCGSADKVYGLIKNNSNGFWLENAVFVERIRAGVSRRHHKQVISELIRRGIRVFSNFKDKEVIYVHDPLVARALLRFKYFIATSDVFTKDLHSNSFHRILYWGLGAVPKGANIIRVPPREPLLQHLDDFLNNHNDLTDLRHVEVSGSPAADLYTELSDDEFIIRQFADYCCREPSRVEVDRCLGLLKKMPRSELNTIFAYCDESLARENGLFFPPLKSYDAMSSAGDLKVAILLTGHLRTFQQTYPTIRKNLVTPLGADVYVHTWSGIGKQKTDGKFGLVSDETDKVDAAVAKSILPEIVDICIEDNHHFISNAKMANEKPFMYGTANGSNSAIYTAKPVHIESQLYSSNRAFQMMELSEQKNGMKYDLIIKMRSDICVLNGLPNIGKLKPEDLWVSSPPNSLHNHPLCSACLRGKHEGLHSAEVCDIYAYGGRSAMGHYLSLWSNLETVYARMKKENEINVKNPNVAIGSCDGFVTAPVNYNSANYRLHLFYPERLFRLYLEKMHLLPGILSCMVIR